ncbi:hypothetical protein [Streptomyces sp. R35]|uniref:Uncharacterized protein n=1 Tax=Streptomyces sp. R35 TaxID=3238630 RepID=A0AB39S130_9ACTN
MQQQVEAAHRPQLAVLIDAPVHRRAGVGLAPAALGQRDRHRALLQHPVLGGQFLQCLRVAAAQPGRVDEQRGKVRIGHDQLLRLGVAGRRVLAHRQPAVVDLDPARGRHRRQPHPLFPLSHRQAFVVVEETPQQLLARHDPVADGGHVGAGGGHDGLELAIGVPRAPSLLGAHAVPGLPGIVHHSPVQPFLTGQNTHDPQQILQVPAGGLLPTRLPPRHQVPLQVTHPQPLHPPRRFRKLVQEQQEPLDRLPLAARRPLRAAPAAGSDPHPQRVREIPGAILAAATPRTGTRTRGRPHR